MDKPQLATAAGHGDWIEPRQKVAKAQMPIVLTVFATCWCGVSASVCFFSIICSFSSLIILLQVILISLFCVRFFGLGNFRQGCCVPEVDFSVAPARRQDFIIGGKRDIVLGDIGLKRNYLATNRQIP
jgi:hypothetical protein